MKTEQYRIIEKSSFNDFINSLIASQKVIGPVYKGFNNYSFEGIKSAQEMSLNYIPTIIPPKKYFMPQKETILEFDTKETLHVEPVSEYEELILFGVHTCDIAGLRCLNVVLSDEPKDISYLIRKRYITIIGLECNAYCDEYASCSFVGAHVPTTGYDLMFTDLGDYFIVHIHSSKGMDIVKQANIFKPADNYDFEALKALRGKKDRIFNNEVPTERRYLPDLIDRSWNASVWKELEQKCLGCGNCTSVCPTCYCFDIKEDVDFTLKAGQRYRVWFSCQLDPFAKVAGGIDFRRERSARQRHRFYRKFRYHIDRYGMFFCTGCGRCSRTCMAKINLKEVLTALIKESETKIWRKWL
ncbi:MAG TPA: 4Fe-4S dicluster domain-containing protein [Thermodesulfovibrio thiophilus]|nr:4Fe-4S dicluster domain-containing protein [Thermodesulfovibrio thiophilus]HQD36864.1 4Fe-4S dicluster domain-containing protein [Thermodesulfovibrio thiophilus]